jgi:hypothetical protein
MVGSRGAVRAYVITLNETVKINSYKFSQKILIFIWHFQLIQINKNIYLNNFYENYF